MFNRIEVQIIHMYYVIAFITDSVFPKSALLDSSLPVLLPNF